MYAEFFGLTELPFNNTPNPRFFFSTPDHEEALASMVYAVDERKGFMLLTGEAGTGKTLLAKLALHHFGNRICSASMSHSVPGTGDMLASVCHEFGVPVSGDANMATCIRVLHDFLLAQYAHDTPVVLFIDEAQALSKDDFEQLRMLGNLEHDNAKLIQTLIIGQPQLRPLFQTPELRQLRQRVFRTFHLPPLTRERCREYLQYRLETAGGGDREIFDDSAVEVIHAHSNGLPRLINTVCDNAMLSAYSADVKEIDGEFVKGVIGQMLTIDQRQVPRETPTAEPPPMSAEFAPAANPRIGHGEAEFSTLADRIRRLEHGLSAYADPAPYSMPLYHAAPHPTHNVVATQTAEQIVQQALSETEQKVTQALDQAESRVQKILKSTENKLAEAISVTDRRLAGMVEKTDQAMSERPEIARAAARRDRQMKRLTSIVKRMVEERAAESEPTTKTTSEADVSPLRILSEKLSDVVHQTRASMGDLRTAIAAVKPPRAQTAEKRENLLPLEFDSPVQSLASEVSNLSDLASRLQPVCPHSR